MLKDERDGHRTSCNNYLRATVVEHTVEVEAWENRTQVS